jgi:ribonuclease VapC
MIVDSSALVAIVLGEPDANRFLDALVDSVGPVRVPATALVESGIVVEARQGQDAGRDLTLLLEAVGAQVEPFDRAQAVAALTAWRRFGKGRHAARLNLGDCFSYALAKVTGEALLSKGTDFDQTDLSLVLEP